MSADTGTSTKFICKECKKMGISPCTYSSYPALARHCRVRHPINETAKELQAIRKKLEEKEKVLAKLQDAILSAYTDSTKPPEDDASSN